VEDLVKSYPTSSTFAKSGKSDKTLIKSGESVVNTIQQAMIVASKTN